MSVSQRSNTYISLFEIEMFIFPIEFVGQSLEKYWIKRGCETDQTRQAQTLNTSQSLFGKAVRTFYLAQPALTVKFW